MKTARIGCMVLGIVLLMFVIANVASAQAITGEWFKGKASLKGYEINGTGGIVGKDSGGTTIYVNIVDGSFTATDVYTVTTCIQDRLDDTWQLGQANAISNGDIYGDLNSGMIWNFFSRSVVQFAGPVYSYPMFNVKVNGSLTKASFKSFVCTLQDDSIAPNFAIGSCSISFKNIDAAKVPRGATGCIITGP
jgi:hypothetical protein